MKKRPQMSTRFFNNLKEPQKNVDESCEDRKKL